LYQREKLCKNKEEKTPQSLRPGFALETSRGVKTISEIAAEFEIQPIMVGNWKKEMLEHLPALFENKNARKEKTWIERPSNCTRNLVS
jgi:hypothetical protein